MNVNKILITITEQDVNLEDRKLLEHNIKIAIKEAGFQFEDMTVGQNVRMKLE